jgi:ribonuclease HII
MENMEELVCGVDEAGRGAWAGPVAAGAVILGEAIPGLADSKLLSARQRERLAQRIRGTALAWAVGLATAAEVDRMNVLKATLLAMHRALCALPVVPQRLVVDGAVACALPGHWRIHAETLVSGDLWHPCIQAGAILAKVTRDHLMAAMGVQYPAYGFGRHKGYGTMIHRQALQACGPCPQHRMTFAPVRLAQRGPVP